MDHIGPEVQLTGSLDDSPGEVSEALTVIEVTVELPALEIVLVVHEPVGHAVALQREHAAVNLPPGQGDVEILQEGHLAAPLAADAFIQGENYLDLMTRLGQSLGQRAGHIGQTAGFNKRGHLGGGKQNFHISSPFPVPDIKNKQTPSPESRAVLRPAPGVMEFYSAYTTDSFAMARG